MSCRKNCKQINELTLSIENCCNRKVETAKPGMILKDGCIENIKPTGQPKTATKKQKHFDLRYEIKAATEKSTSQQQPKSLKAYEFCPSPQQQKTKALKTKKK